MENLNNKNYTGAIIIVIVIAILIFFIARGPKSPTVENPAPTASDNWETATTTVAGGTFLYPADLATRFITPTDWPPILNSYDESFTCSQTGKEIERAGETKLETIAGHEYCVTRVTEGAAGSSYTQYAYARAAKDKTEVLTFSLRFVQCGNYDKALMSECEVERAAFDIGPTVDEIFSTIKN